MKFHGISLKLKWPIFSSFLDIFALMLSFKPMNVKATFSLCLCSHRTSLYRDAQGHIIAFSHYRYFSYHYIYICRNVLNWDRPGSKGPNRSSTDIFGYKQGFTGSNFANTYHNRCEPWCYRSPMGLYQPNTWANQGWECLQRARFITVETRTLRESSRLNTIFVSLPGDSRWLPVVFNILEQPGNELVEHCSSCFAKVVHYWYDVMCKRVWLHLVQKIWHLKLYYNKF